MKKLILLLAIIILLVFGSCAHRKACHNCDICDDYAELIKYHHDECDEFCGDDCEHHNENCDHD